MLQKLFKKDTKDFAQELLGMYLVHESAEGKTVGKIVETEAYLWNDPAAHSFRGKTQRNAPMFGKPGTAYIYFTYGMHYCFNVVTANEGVGEAVLIRALEPIEGIALMKKRRKMEDLYSLCNGPAKLVQAMGIIKELNTHFLLEKPLYLLSKKEAFSLVAKTRIGISKAQKEKLRFYMKGNNFVSSL
ncbi:MAG TPA: DNA-3-methyladenine glycosylase [Nanoarchaeota archaeon]|nr:DNA-3-methyladenine glycosylase [Candidatus Woesearchaeota archaeon]HIH14935.1 DNA-3-methyladenine glycosylase [Nanoarchaeota archaeon]HIH58416.1 DNA-3-methyladenine glycosylase [Nanoarchaeota archaeon]HII14491.1 DNA-3-methyladenine glycosylase [Nanoarchaeota archaeon]HIJ05641.1 DNA-3-methyladenine glycosylase [Nanoarchaeota archaeon]